MEQHDPPRLVVAGGSGLVGRELRRQALERGWEVVVLSRTSGPGKAAYDPAAAARGEQAAVQALATALDGAAAVVNLAGYSVADGSFDQRHKDLILSSRLDTTRAVIKGIAACQTPPPVFFNSSAVGYYGEAGEEDRPEDGPRGQGYLAEVCEQWEAAAREAQALQPAPRLVIGRIGVVLGAEAPAWTKLKTPLSWGVAGPLGSGRQWWSWIDILDLARAILFLLETEEAQGVFNLTAPEPVRQADLVRQAGLLMGRPAFLPAPAFALRLVLGQTADELLLTSCRALPTRLLELGFEFERPLVERTLVTLIP